MLYENTVLQLHQRKYKFKKKLEVGYASVEQRYLILALHLTSLIFHRSAILLSFIIVSCLVCILNELHFIKIHFLVSPFYFCPFKTIMNGERK